MEDNNPIILSLFNMYPQYKYNRIKYEGIQDDKQEILPKQFIKINNTNITVKIIAPIIIINDATTPIFSVKYSFKYILECFLKTSIIHIKYEISDHILSELSKQYNINIIIVDDNCTKLAPSYNNIYLCCYKSSDFIYYQLNLSPEEIIIIKKISVLLFHLDDDADEINKDADEIIKDADEIIKDDIEIIKENVLCSLIPKKLTVKKKPNLLTIKKLMRMKLCDLQTMAIEKNLNIFNESNKKLKKEELANIIICC